MFHIECKENPRMPNSILPFEQRYSVLFRENGKKKVVYIKNWFDDTIFRYRCINFSQSLENSSKYEITYFLCDEIPKVKTAIYRMSMIVFQRAIWIPDIQNMILIASKNNIPVIFDIDDLLFTNSHAVSYINHICCEYDENTIMTHLGIASGYNLTASSCDAFLTTTPALKRNLEHTFGKPAFIVPNFLNHEQMAESEIINKERVYDESRFVIGYFSGSPSHTVDFRSIENDLIALLDKYDDIYIVIVGFMELFGKLKEYKLKNRIIQKGLLPYQELQYEIGKADVNIIPLVINEFNQAKSELKYFEAGIVKTPSCAAPTDVYKAIIKDGENGFLCNDGEWFEAIEKLYLDKQLRFNMGEAAYKTSTELYLPEKLTDTITEAFDKLMELN